METWPATLPQVPEQQGYSRIVKPNTIRSQMGYGPDKLRRRATAEIYHVTIPLWLDYDQYATLDAFYLANQALTWEWLDFGRRPTITARYRFLAPPGSTSFGAAYWQTTLSLEMCTSG